jgi:hypothetical protein
MFFRWLENLRPHNYDLQVNSHAHKPSPVDIDTIQTTIKAVCQQRDINLPNNNIPVNCIYVPVPDQAPNDYELMLAVQKLKKNKAPYPTGLQAEGITHWMTDRYQTN